MCLYLSLYINLISSCSRDALEGAENSLNLVLASNRNRLLRVEVFISTVTSTFALCTVVSGFYGMNTTDVQMWEPTWSIGEPWLNIVLTTSFSAFFAICLSAFYLQRIVEV